MSTVSEHVGIFSPNRRRGVNTEIFADATDAVVDSSITIRGTEEGSSAEAKIDFVQDSNLKEIPEITLKSDVKREYEGVETLQDKAIIAAGYEKTEYYSDDADNAYTKTTYEHDAEGLRQETQECEINGGVKTVTSSVGFNVSSEGFIFYDGEDSWGIEKTLNGASLVGPIQCETPDGTDPYQIVNVDYAVGRVGDQEITGTLTVQNSTGSTINLSPSTITLSDSVSKNISLSPGVISAVFTKDGTTVRNTLTYTLSSNNVTNELTISAFDTDTSTLVGEVVFGPNKVSLKGSTDSGYTTLVSSSGHAVFDKVVEAITPTDATNKKQLVTIEYLENALANI